MKGITYSVGTSGSRLPRRTRLVWALTIALLIINILMQFNRSNISLHFWKQSVKNSSQPFNWSDVSIYAFYREFLANGSRSRPLHLSNGYHASTTLNVLDWTSPSTGPNPQSTNINALPLRLHGCPPGSP
jgi:hypothetical protein